MKTLLLVSVFAAGIIAVPAAAQAQKKIGVVSVDDVLLKSHRGKQVVAQLNQFGKRERAKLVKMEKEVAASKKRLVNAGAGLSSQKRRSLILEQERQRRLLRLAREGATRDFRRRTETVRRTFNARVLQMIHSVAKRKGLLLVLKRGGDGVYYAAPSIDITKEVIRAMNRAYPARKRK